MTAPLRLALAAERRHREAALRARRGAETAANAWRDPDGSLPDIDPTVPGNEEAYREVTRLRAELETTAAGLTEAETAYAAAVAAYDDAATSLFDTDNGDPILLLPVRIEAVYRAAELWLRVYPDDIHVDSHEPALTEGERDAGERYWREVTAAGPDPARRAAAWTALVAAAGGNRAVWVRDVLTPRDGAFPPVDSRPQAWTRAARTALLPDRFEFSAYRDGALVWRHQGADLPDTLPVGMAPPAGEEAPDGLPWDERSRWLVDFDQAVANGMGIVVSLTAPDERFDLLTVVGVSAAPGTENVANCLSAHAFTGGLSTIQPGTPTNNTPGSRSGWRSRTAPQNPDQIETWRSAYDPSSTQDAARLAGALGLDGHRTLAGVCDPTAGEEPLLRRMHELQGKFYAWSRAWRPLPAPEVYWPAPMTDDWYRLLADHYTSFVRGRGPLPSLLVGRQPYGVLPVSSTDLWRDFDREALLAEAIALLTTAQSYHPHNLPAQREAANGSLALFLRLAALSGWPDDQRRQIAECLRQLVGYLSPDLPDDLAVTAAETARAQFAQLAGDQRFWIAVTWLGQAAILHPAQLDRQRAAAAEALSIYAELADGPVETAEQVSFLDTVAEHLRQLVGYLSPELPGDLAVVAAEKARATWTRLPGDHRFRIAVTWLGQAAILHPAQLDRQQAAAAEALSIYLELADGPIETAEQVSFVDTVAEHLRQLVGYLPPDLAVVAAEKARATWARLPGDHRFRIAVTWLGQAAILHPAQLDRQQAAAAEALSIYLELADGPADTPDQVGFLDTIAEHLRQLMGYLTPELAVAAAEKARATWNRLPGDHRYRTALTWFAQATVSQSAQQHAAAAEALTLLITLADEALPLIAAEPARRGDLTVWAGLLDQLSGYLDPAVAATATSKAAEIRTALGAP